MAKKLKADPFVQQVTDLIDTALVSGMPAAAIYGRLSSVMFGLQTMVVGQALHEMVWGVNVKVDYGKSKKGKPKSKCPTRKAKT